MPRYGEGFVNEFAPEMWDFTTATIPSISVEIPEYKLAMWNIAARQLFNNQWTPLGERAVRHFMRRIISSANAYEMARQSLTSFFINHKRDLPNLDAYFVALDSHESCLMSLHIAVNALSKLLPKEEVSNLVADTKEISILANNIKHFAGQSMSSNGLHNKTFPIFYRNMGISNGTVTVKYDELEAIISSGLKLASDIINFRAE